MNVTLYFPAFSSPVVPALSWFCLLSLSVCKILEESFVAVAWWSYIFLVSAYHGRLLLLHLF
jgi:hypothetical protein